MSDSTRPEVSSLGSTIDLESRTSAEERSRARRAVAHHARDAQECAELLEALGLKKPADASSAEPAQQKPSSRSKAPV